MTTGDIAPSSLKIDKLMRRIEDGDIKIPAFQRGYVWNQQQVIDILDSIYNDYPIGSILLWNSNERLKSTRNIGGFLIPEKEAEYPVNYVLDGQQRLSSIYAVFCQHREQAPDNQKYNVDITIFDIYFDFDDEKFIPRDEIREDHICFNIDSLLSTEKFIKEYNKLPEKYRKESETLHSKFINYEIPIVTISKKSKNDVGVIFERINSTGTKLTPLDLLVAWTWSDDFHLREKIDEILQILELKSFGDTPDKIVLQCLGAIIKKTTTTKVILSLAPEAVKGRIDHLKSSLEKTVDFLSTELKIKSRDFLPHSHQMVPLAYFFSIINNPSNEQTAILKQWFWKTSFSKRYAGSTDKKMNDDIVFIDEIISGDYSNIIKYSHSINKETLVNQQFSKSSPYTRAFLLLLAQKNPLNIANGNKIDLGKALSKYNLREYHHIFPKSFLKNKGYETDMVNSLCNFTFLPSSSNKVISNKAPSEYILEITPQDKLDIILNSNLMPPNNNIYENNSYEVFLENRAELIIQYIETISNQ